MALVYFFNALDLLDGNSNRIRIAHLKFEIGKTYLQTGNLNLARNYLNAARQSHELGTTRESLIDTLLLLGDLPPQAAGGEGSPSCSWRTPLTTGEPVGDIRRQLRPSACSPSPTSRRQQALESYKNFHQRASWCASSRSRWSRKAVRQLCPGGSGPGRSRSWSSSSTRASTSRSATSGPASPPGCCWRSSSTCSSPSGSS